MNEQETNTGNSQTPTASNTPGGDKSDIDGRIKRINEAAERLEIAERKLAERESSLKEADAIRRIGGVTGGAPQEAALKVETAKEYSLRVMGNKIVAR